MKRMVLVAVVGVVLLLAGCQRESHLLTTTSTEGTSSVGEQQRAAPARVTVPAVSGRNGRIVRDQLHALGLKRVTFASQDPRARVPILLGNWTAVRIEPPVGSTVRPSDTVVVTLTRNR
jgi:hypothetical protein